MLVTDLKGHIKEDRQTMRSSIGHFTYILRISTALRNDANGAKHETLYL